MMKIAALYQFKPLPQPEQVKELLEVKTKQHGIVGMLMLATEGINGTIAGEESQLHAFLDFLIHQLDFNNLELKFSYYEGKVAAEDVLSPDSPFYRMRISVKREIVTMGIPNVDMRLLEENPEDKIQFVPPGEWNSVIGRENVLVVDARNDYEVDIGSFSAAINPHTKTFKQFPQFIDQLMEDREKDEKINESSEKPDLAIFCTGGIRCEKAAVYLSQLKHFNKIYQLKGGILRYIEEVPEEVSSWEGECFVFDQRVSVKHGLKEGDHSLCRGCRHPLSSSEMTSEAFYLEGVHCKHCYSSLTEKQIEGLKERQLQMKLAKERKIKHLGGNYKTPKPRQRRQRTRKTATNENEENNQAKELEAFTVSVEEEKDNDDDEENEEDDDDDHEVNLSESFLSLE